MAGGRRKPRPRARRAPKPVPLALAPVDLLAGLAPGVELHADDLPPGIDEESAARTPLPATLTVAEAGRLIRSGEGTIRRLIRTTVLTPEPRPAARKSADTDRAGVTLVRGDLRGIVRARRLSRATLANIRQNLFLAFIYNAIGVPIAAGVLYPFAGWLVNPVWASAAMTLSSLSVITNALRLRNSRL